MMRSGVLGALVVVVGIAVSAGAQDIVIDSIKGNGSMSFWGAQVGTTATVEWAASLTDAGRTNWYGLTNLVVTNNFMGNDLPVFFRVRGIPDTNFMNGLIAWYPFMNGNANDESGRSNNATVYGASLVDDRFGRPNAAYSFNGSSDYLLAPDSSDWNLGGADFTVACWLKMHSFAGPQYVLGQCDGTNPLQTFAEDRWTPGHTLNVGVAPFVLPSALKNYLSSTEVGDVYADYDYSTSVPFDTNTPIQGVSLDTNLTIWVADVDGGTNTAVRINELDLTPPVFFRSGVPYYGMFGLSWKTNDTQYVLEGDAYHTYVPDGAPAYTNVSMLGRFEYNALSSGPAVYLAPYRIEVRTFLPEADVQAIMVYGSNQWYNGFMYLSASNRIVATDEAASGLLTASDWLGFTTPIQAAYRIPVYLSIPLYAARPLWGQPVDPVNYTNRNGGVENVFVDAIGGDDQWTPVRASAFALTLNNNSEIGFRYHTTIYGSPVYGAFQDFALPLDRFFHLTVVRRGGELQCLIDGRQYGVTHSIGAAVLYDSSLPVVMGRLDAANGGYLHGTIDDIRGYNRPLSLNEVSRLLIGSQR